MRTAHTIGEAPLPASMTILRGYTLRELIAAPIEVFLGFIVMVIVV